MSPNNSFKPNLLRYSNGVAEKACHAVASTTQVGLTQALYGYQPMSDLEIQTALHEYLRARATLLELGRKYPHRFSGNDNIIGRFGEFVALQFLERLGQRPEKVVSSSNPGFDLIEGSLRTQVKVITAENQRGRTVRLKEPWDQLLLIQLCPDYRPLRIGLLTKTQFAKASKARHLASATPFVTLGMLGPKGLISKYGRVYQQHEIAV